MDDGISKEPTQNSIDFARLPPTDLANVLGVVMRNTDTNEICLSVQNSDQLTLAKVPISRHYANRKQTTTPSQSFGSSIINDNCFLRRDWLYPNPTSRTQVPGCFT